MSSKKTLSATDLATYHHLNCDLYLHKVYHGPLGRGIHQPSEISRAQFERGNDWESRLFTWLQEETLLLRVPSNPLQADCLVENIELDDRKHFYIAGITFWPPKAALNAKFCEEGVEGVDFGRAKPDLLEIRRAEDGCIVWTVIDAKASNAVKTPHHVQVYFYHLCLTYILPRPRFRPSGTTAIWLPPADGFDSSPPSFSDLKIINVSLLSPLLHSFLFRQLPKIISLPPETVEWHYNPLCRSCPYDAECRVRAVGQNELGSMPNISLDEAKTLKSLLTLSRGQHRAEKPLTDIEDLHTLISQSPKLDMLERLHPSTIRKSKRILGISVRKSNVSTGNPCSPAIDAARTKVIQVKHRRNFTCPRSEDVAVVISLLQDPSTPRNGITQFCISIFSKTASCVPPEPIHSSAPGLVRKLASVIQSILSLNPVPLTQFYVFSSNEQTTLQSHLIDAALASSPSDTDIRLCIGALAEGASFLSTIFQPLVLSGAFLDFLASRDRTKAELQACAQRLGLMSEGSSEELRSRVEHEIHRLKLEGRRGLAALSNDKQMELGQLNRVVVVKDVIEGLLALPIPGYWDLPECASVLLPPNSPECPSDEGVFNAYKTGNTVRTRSLLKVRNWYIYEVLSSLRVKVSSQATGRGELLVNEARVLSPNFMDICREEQLRKLFFIQQFEVLAKLTKLWHSRIEGCPDVPILEYKHSNQATKGVEHVFHLVYGTVDKQDSFYNYLLVEDTDAEDGNSIPVEALFDDLSVSGMVFPLNKFTESRWTAQHRDVQKKLRIADLRDVAILDLGQKVTAVTLHIWDNWDFQPVEGQHYRLSSRLVDFNVTKVLSTLLELDLRCDQDGDGQQRVPFLRLISGPRSFAIGEDESKAFLNAENAIQRSFRELRDLGNNAAGALVLKPSQHHAVRRILSSRLSVIWGPPGTGKTYTIALSLLRLLEVQSRLGNTKRQIIFITAHTHAAIQACHSKLLYSIERYRAIESLPTAWLDDVSVERVDNGKKHPAPGTKSISKFLFAGTVYQLYHFSKSHSLEIDCVVIDEAGQLSLSLTTLVLRALGPTGRIVVAGDSEQLAPILTARYPLVTRRLFGSVLDCLVHLSMDPIKDQEDGAVLPMSSQEVVVQLTENFRLNPDLGDFISTIYSHPFKPQKVQARQLASRLKSIKNDVGRDLGVQHDVLKNVQRILLALSDVMLRKTQTILQPPPRLGSLNTNESDIHSIAASDPSISPHPISLALIRLQTCSSRPEPVGYELHVQGEAAVAAALVTSIRRCSPDDDIFIATPHHMQRHAVEMALGLAHLVDEEHEMLVDDMRSTNVKTRSRSSSHLDRIKVDTVEKLQGSEAAFVICLFSLPQSDSTSKLGFMLERRRLNVAISRTKTLCIMVTSSEVLRPSVRVLANEESAKGYKFLREFEERAWSSTLIVNVDSL